VLEGLATIAFEGLRTCNDCLGRTLRCIGTEFCCVRRVRDATTAMGGLVTMIALERLRQILKGLVASEYCCVRREGDATILCKVDW
jgi:hypothetical protein